jgi:hypothetical protein
MGVVVPRQKRILTEEQKAKMIRNLQPGGNNEAIQKSRAHKREVWEAARKSFQTCDIMEFSISFLQQSFEGFPFQELVLRCSAGLPLPEGTLKTFIEVPSAGFAVKEVEMTWPEYFKRCSGGKTYKPGVVPDIVICRVGRRAGKSTAAAIKALHCGTRSIWRKYVRPSEVMTIAIVATSQDQAEKIITQRCQEILKDADMDWVIGGLDPKMHLDQPTNDTIPLLCGTEIQAFPCNSKKVRGPAAPLVIFDEYPEFAFEGRKKDEDIRDAACGAQGQFPGAQFWGIGTPGAKEGDFYNLEQLAADDPSILALHAPSWEASPKLYRENPKYYHNWFKRSPQSFDRELRANYAESVEPAFREEDVDAALCLAGELPYNGEWRYGAGIDQSGLSGNDRFSLVVCHYDPQRDMCGESCRRSWAISDLDIIMAEIQQVLRAYRVHEVMLDRYAKEYVSSALAKKGIGGIASLDTASLCMDFRQLLVAHKMELPMQKAVKDGLMQTQMFYTAKSHKPTISHPRRTDGHGDEVDGRFRAVYQAVHGNWMAAQTEEDEKEYTRAREEEESYDPLSYGRV